MAEGYGIVQRILSFAAIIVAAASLANAQSTDDLLGTWAVDLYFSTDAPPSQTELVVTDTADGKLTGTFYGSPFGTGRVAIFEGSILFTAVTEDNSGPYLHSGRLAGNEIEGQTLSTGRDFLMPWRARRLED